MKKLLTPTFLNNFRPGLISLGVVISRMGFFAPNFSLLGSFGFFGGNFFYYFASIVFFDAVVGGFYPGFIFTYLGFLSYYILGKLSVGNVKRQLILLPIASFLFFLISNWGSFLSMYEFNLKGLMLCYSAAVPFYQRTLLGDLFFGYLFLIIKLSMQRVSLNNQALAVQKSSTGVKC